MCAREIYKKFVYKHSETISYIKRSSINDQYPPAHLHDGDMTTYCKPASQNNWIQFKFSQIYLIRHVEIKVHVYTKNYYWLRIGVNGDDP